MDSQEVCHAASCRNSAVALGGVTRKHIFYIVKFLPVSAVPQSLVIHYRPIDKQDEL